MHPSSPIRKRPYTGVVTPQPQNQSPLRRCSPPTTIAISPSSPVKYQQQQRAPTPTAPSSPLASPVPLRSTTLLTTHIKLGERIGHGSFGQVYAAEPTARGKLLFGVVPHVVVKCMSLDGLTQEAVDLALKEAEVLAALSGSMYIVRAIHVWIEVEPRTRKGKCPTSGPGMFVTPDAQTLCVAMERADRGDVEHVLENVRNAERPMLSPEEVLDLLVHCLLGLDVCHSAGILHRDVKPQNILLFGGRGAAANSKLTWHVAKLADFGLARYLEHGDFAMTHVGTPYFVSPEIVSDTPYTDRTDVWSLGVCLFEWMTLKKPFQGANLVHLSKAILEQPLPDIAECVQKAHQQHAVRMALAGHEPRPDHCFPEELFDLCRRMLDRVPTLRPSTSEVLSMPWLASARASAEARHKTCYGATMRTSPVRHSTTPTKRSTVTTPTKNRSPVRTSTQTRMASPPPAVAQRGNAPTVWTLAKPQLATAIHKEPSVYSPNKGTVTRGQTVTQLGDALHYSSRTNDVWMQIHGGGYVLFKQSNHVLWERAVTTANAVPPPTARRMTTPTRVQHPLLPPGPTGTTPRHRTSPVCSPHLTEQTDAGPNLNLNPTPTTYSQSKRDRLRALVGESQYHMLMDVVASPTSGALLRGGVASMSTRTSSSSCSSSCSSEHGLVVVLRQMLGPDVFEEAIRLAGDVHETEIQTQHHK
eukprot:PhM_4_TR17727/c0_g1_i1/m.31801/K08857/NEK1_4_5; NIMA (never in mitosis gene a)-related kinase 1/4/5